MNLSSLAEKIAKYIPSVSPPLYRIGFREKLKWTGIILILYIFLSYVPVFGLRLTPQAQYLLTIQHLLGARFGSLLTLGIGPIVTAGIILQLLVGSKVINLDTTKPEGRKKFQTWEKVLAVIFTFIEASAYVLFGPFTTVTILLPLVILQIALGGILVILMDDVVSKWGIGSGISLFIVAGIASQVFIRIFSPFPTGCSILNLSACIPSFSNMPVGLFWQMLLNFYNNNPTNALYAFLPILSTIIIFLIVVYVQSISVDIPLAFSMFRGFGRIWSLKLLYTSNIPVILMWALLANLQFISHLGIQQVEANKFCGPLGCFDSNGNAISGFAYFISPPRGLVADIVEGRINRLEILRAFTYFLLMVVGSTLFSIIWVEVSGMDAKSIAEQLESIGMHIPGYRRDPRVIESVLSKYIPPLAALGGMVVGALAALADWLGAIGSGTGILLSVMIVYNYYELIRNENLEDAPLFVKKLFGV